MKIEDNFTRMAREGGLSEEDAKSAYNSNMMSNGLLTMNVAKFAHDHGRRWLVTAYEAGDVVLHKPHAVGT
jgi:phytanoyl-CoA hydroxylase